MKLNEKSWFVIPALICLVYILLRFWHLTDSCLWFDEVFSVHAAEHDWENIFSFVAQDLIHPPLFYILLKLWISVGGESLFWLRFFPALFAAVAVVPFYLLCRALKLNYPTIALAFAFFAANGALIKYAQEVRMYSLLLCLSLFSLWLFVRFLNLGKNFWILTVINVLLVYTHYFGWLVILSEVAAILILQRIKIRQILFMFGINLVAFVPWIFAILEASRTNSDLSQNIGWIKKPNLFAVIDFIFDSIEPLYFQQSSIDATSHFYITLPFLLVLVFAAIFYIFDWRNRSDIEKRDFLLLTIFIKLPVLLAFAASWLLPYSIWGTRHLIIIFAPLSILAAIFINKLNPARLKMVFVSLTVLIFAAAFAVEITTSRTKQIVCGWENLARNIDADKAQRIYTFEDLSAYLTWFALRDNDRTQVVKLNVNGLVEDKAYFLPRGFDKITTADENGVTGDKFWILFRDKDFRLNEPPLRNLILKGYKIGEPEIYEAQGVKAFLVLVEK
jgi:uncharacterized membrane protein